MSSRPGLDQKGLSDYFRLKVHPIPSIALYVGHSFLLRQSHKPGGKHAKGYINSRLKKSEYLLDAYVTHSRQHLRTYATITTVYSEKTLTDIDY